ncbi:glycoside hydrolase [Russula ochroleuca]|uniref:Glycoside hydrolase n=1 Tax=Russula ochroleuca TaxID=152965 RepID=A0A9P5TDG3_9AGAM|nr:glycoside hydrolase [Russula ochroleuca]
MARSLAHHQGSRLLALVILVVLLAPKVVHAYDITKNDNDVSGQQKDLNAYCQDDTIDNIVIAFWTTSICTMTSDNSDGSKKRTQGAGYSLMSSQIKECQASRKIIIISLGGETSQVGFTTDSQAETFADQIWDMFLGGSGQERPFGDAVLDGADLDIEREPFTGYAAFVYRLREHVKGGTNRLYVTAAPHCPSPDAHIQVGAALKSAPFDAVYVQFYKVYIGALAGIDGSGYLSVNTFGGVMHWEASLAVGLHNLILSSPARLLTPRV